MKKPYPVKLLLLSIILLIIGTNNKLQAQLEITIDGLDSVYCSGSSDINLTTYPYGGVLSGPGISGNSFSPSNAGAGQHEIKYMVDTVVYTYETEGHINPVLGTGNPVDLSKHNMSDSLNIGFDFYFFGNTYSSVLISPFGFLTFTDNGFKGCCKGQDIPATRNPNNLIAFSWGYPDLSLGGTIDYFTIGRPAERIFVVNFKDVPNYYTEEPITVQVQLHESDSSIKILVDKIDANYGAFTMGVENIDGTMGYAVENRNASSWTSFDETIIFKPVQMHDSLVVKVNVEETPSSLFFSGSDINYGESYIGYTKTRTINFVNTGCDTIYIDSIQNSIARFYHNEALPVTIAPGNESEIDIIFKPSSVSSVSDTFLFYTSHIDTFVTVTGRGIIPPELSLSKLVICDTIEECDGTSANSFYIKNKSGSDLVYDIPGTVKFTDDFEDGSVDDWKPTNEDASADTASIYGASGNYAIKITINRDHSYSTGVKKTFPKFRPDYFKIKVNPDINSGSSCWVSLGSSLSQVSLGAIFFYFYRQKANIYGVQVCNKFYYINSYDWHTVEIKNINYVNQTFDFYLNEELLGENIGFFRPASSISQVSLCSQSVGTSYYDDVFLGNEIEWFSATPGQGTVPENDSALIVVTTKSTGLNKGSYNTEMAVTTNDPDNPFNYMKVKLFVDISPEMEISEPAIDFGNVFINGTVCDTIVLQSVNCSGVFIDSIVVDGKGFSTGDVTFPEIEPGSSEQFNVIFAPVAGQPYSGSLRIYSNAVSDTIPLTGNGIAAPELFLSASYINDTVNACTGVSQKIFYIKNSGEHDLDFSVKAICDNTITSSRKYSSKGASTKHYMVVEQKIDSLSVIVTVNGDYSNPLEYAKVFIEGYELGIVSFKRDNIDISREFQIPAEIINLVSPGDSIEVTVQNSPGVDAGYINDLHTVTFNMQYIRNITPSINSGSITAADSVIVNVDLAVENIVSKPYTNLLLVSTNDPLHPVDTVRYNFIVDGEPTMVGITECVDFGTVCSGIKSAKYFELTNTGCDTLFIDSIMYSPDFYVFYPAHVLPFRKDTVRVDLDPSADSVYQGEVLTLYTNAGSQDVCITAESVSSDANSFVSTDSISFTVNCENTGTDIFYIKNTGGADLIFEISVEGNIADKITLSDTEGTLVSMDSMLIGLTYFGENVLGGTYKGMLIINTNEAKYCCDTVYVSVIDSFLYVASIGLLADNTDICEGETATLTVVDNGIKDFSWTNGSKSDERLITSPGNYRVTGIDYNYCESSASAGIHVHQPHVELGTDTTILETGSIQLDAGGHNTYLWSTDETTRTIDIDGASLGSGQFNYYVVVSDLYGCSDSDSITITIEEVRVDVISENFINQGNTRVYPNPASDMATIEFNLKSGKISMQLLSIDNRVIYNETLNNVTEGTKLSIDVSQIPSGIYYIVLQTADYRMVEKLVVE